MLLFIEYLKGTSSIHISDDDFYFFIFFSKDMTSWKGSGNCKCLFSLSGTLYCHTLLFKWT